MKLIKLLAAVLIITSAFLFSNLSAEPLGTTGKITGKVTDNKTKTPLVGAIVKIDGTNMGASTDDAGDYVIINIPVGTYSVRCQYVGFEAQVQTEVRVSADLTTKVDFSLDEVVIKTDTLEIIAKRNTLSPDQSGKIITEENIVNTGIRGIENIAAKTAGVVQDERGDAINVRGGRTNETVVIIDGVITTNPLDGESTAYVSNSLLQEMSVLTGGFSAEYGNVLSGVINVTTKSGQTKYSGVLEVVSDAVYSNMLNSSSTGYNIYNASIGGPLVPTKKLKNFMNFYGGVERNYFSVSSPSWIAQDLGTFYHIDESGTVVGSDNDMLPGFALDRWSWNGKINFDFSELNKKTQLRLTAGVNGSRTNDRLWVQSYMRYNGHRNPALISENDQFYGKVTHQVGTKTFYEVQFNFFDNHEKQADPLLMDDLFGYGDPSKVPGAPAMGSRVPFDAYGLFANYNRVNNFYSKSETMYYEGSFNVTSQLKNNELKIGGNYRYHTIRYYEVRPAGLAAYSPTDPNIRSIFTGGIGLANFWGYSYDGQSTIDGDAVQGDPTTFDGAKHPIVASFYAQDKVEFKDFTINAGLRYDYLDANTWRIKDITNIVRFGNPNALDAEDFDVNSEPTSAISPRLGFSFPVTERTIFHAQYGKFIQLPQLEFLYNGYENLSYWVNSAGFSGSFGNPNLKPEKTTSYEIGFKQQVGEKLSFDLTAFYKETEDLIGIAKYPQLPNQVQVYENQDYGTIRGFDLAVDFRRTSGVAFSIAYSLSFASGTGSNPNSAGTAAWLGDQQPKFTYPLDFDQRHTGTINFDYRFGKDNLPKGTWGDILSRLGLNLLYSFNSGRPYSKKDPTINPFQSTGGGATLTSTINGAYGPWNQRLDLKLDKWVPIWKLDVNFYVWVLNVLNTELVSDVWEGSGQPGTTGYLTTQNGVNYSRAYDEDGNPNTSSQEFEYLYGLRSKEIDNYGPPRQIRFGIRLNF